MVAATGYENLHDGKGNLYVKRDPDDFCSVLASTSNQAGFEPGVAEFVRLDPEFGRLPCTLRRLEYEAVKKVVEPGGDYGIPIRDFMKECRGKIALQAFVDVAQEMYDKVRASPQIKELILYGIDDLLFGKQEYFSVLHFAALYKGAYTPTWIDKIDIISDYTSWMLKYEDAFDCLGGMLENRVMWWVGFRDTHDDDFGGDGDDLVADTALGWATTMFPGEVLSRESQEKTQS